MIADDPDLLDVLVRDQTAQDGVHKAGRYWSGYASRIVAAIEQHGLASFRDTPAISKGYADSIVTDPADLWHGGWKNRLLRSVAKLGPTRRLLDPYVELIDYQARRARQYRSEAFTARYGDRVHELFNDLEIDSTRGGSRDLVVLPGRTVAAPYLRHAIQSFAVARVAPLDQARVFIEVGGGFGANTHWLLERFPTIRKVIYIDIVPTLYVGTQYLRSFYGDSVRDHRSTRHLDTIRFEPDEQREILCLPPWRLPAVEARADVFWNDSSMREMDLDQLHFYAREVKRLGAAHICLFGPPTTPKSGGRLSVDWDDVVAAFGPDVTFASLEFDPPDVDGDAAWIGRS